MAPSYGSTITMPDSNAKASVKRRKTSVVQGRFAFDEESLYSWLRGIVKNRIDLFKVSDRLNLNPSTVRKILEGGRISKGTFKKIEAGYRNCDLLDGDRAGDKSHEPNHWTIESLMEVYRLYQEEKSLQSVGRKLNLTREWVRQLLKKGAEIGLFKYKPRKPPILSREKILDDFGRFLKYKEVAKVNRISRKYLYKLMALHRITDLDLRSVRLEGRRRQCREEYWEVARKLGRHPTVTELVRKRLNRPLEFKIRSTWGSLDLFRKELNIIPGMPVGNETRNIPE